MRFKAELFERAFDVVVTGEASGGEAYSGFGESEPTAAEIDAASLSR